VFQLFQIISVNLFLVLSGTFWSGAISTGCPGFGYQWCYSNEPVDYSFIMRPPFSPSLMPCFMIGFTFGAAAVTENACFMPFAAACESY